VAVAAPVVSSDRVPATRLAALGALVKWMDVTKMPSMVIGGVAASVLGRPRLSQDVDALENDSDENPQRFAVDHFAFPVAFFSSMGLGRPIRTVSAKASRASSSTETFSM